MRRQDILLISAKEGRGVTDVLDVVIEKIPLPDSRSSPAHRSFSEGGFARSSLRNQNGNEQRLLAVAPRSGAKEGANEQPATPSRALIFDAIMDTYRGVVATSASSRGRFARGSGHFLEPKNILRDPGRGSFFSPKYVSDDLLSAGQIGYIVTGAKDVQQGPYRRHGRLRPFASSVARIQSGPTDGVCGALSFPGRRIP